ncbi:hypothetical protein SASPL_122884 [Salvia splendens]|uniref:Uncharacterized protein n=1 Tax=Salvia splendens TaxID=180675 RepID=A0A8X8XP69_SALSN|nr:hypothetical protein SASPL_122884 [Salvia splendens]
MGREECIIQVNEEEWVGQMEEELKEEKAYQPQVMAIGPYHHGEEQLKDMEEHKKRALRKFLDRSKKPLHEYVNPYVAGSQECLPAVGPDPKLKCSKLLVGALVDQGAEGAQL